MLLENLKNIPRDLYNVLVGLAIVYAFLILLILNPMQLPIYVVFFLVIYTQMLLIFYILQYSDSIPQSLKTCTACR